MNDDWLKENYEKALLFVGTLIAVALSGWLMVSEGLTFGTNFEQPLLRRNDKMPETGMAELEKASKAMTGSVTWQGEHLFVSEPVLLDDGQLKPVGDGAVHDPIRDEWVLKYGLDITDGDLPNRDPDGDLFTNLEEWLANPKTDPTDLASHPLFISKVCLSSMVRSDLKLEFKSKVDAKKCQINVVSEAKFDGGDVIIGITEHFGPDNMFRLDEFVEKEGFGPGGVPRDDSEVTISYIEPGGVTRVSQTLVRGQEWEFPTHEGNFLNRYDGSEMARQRGSIIKLENDPDNTFTVVEVNAAGAILKDENGRDYQIIPCEGAEE